MARKPGVWFRADREAWYTKIDGRPIMLAKGKGAKREAEREFHRLMSERGQERPPQPVALPVGELVARWLDDAGARAQRGELGPQTPADYRRRLGSFPEACGDVMTADFRPHHLTAWLATQTAWGPTTRHDAVGAVKTMFRWAADEELIDRDPLARVRRPPRPKRRAHVMTPEVWAKVLAAIVSPHFRRLVAFLNLTGCRPKEARELEARHVDLGRGLATLQKHKTEHATGRARLIYLSAEAVELLRPLMAEHPTGPLFRNEDGNGWTRYAVNDQVKRIRDRAGLAKEDGAVAYAIRHIFARDALRRGVGVVETSLLLGHASPRMLFDVYGDLAEDTEHLRQSLETVRPAPGPAPPPPHAAASTASRKRPAAKPAAAPAPPARRSTGKGRRPGQPR